MTPDPEEFICSCPPTLIEYELKFLSFEGSSTLAFMSHLMRRRRFFEEFKTMFPPMSKPLGEVPLPACIMPEATSESLSTVKSSTVLTQQLPLRLNVVPAAFTVMLLT